MGFSHLSRWLWGKRERGAAANSESKASGSHDSRLGYDPPIAPVPRDAGRPKEKGAPGSCSPSEGECRKWQSDAWVVDKEYDLVMIPNDIRRLSDAEEIDWSIGWFEPHASKFLSDCDIEKSFAVLVPCYRPRDGTAMGNAKNSIPGVVAVYEDNKYLEDFLSSLQSS